MAKKRIIDGELYFDSELVEMLGSDGLHLYFRLWGLAEDWGGYEPKYADISLRMGALKISPQKVECYIQKLISCGKIIAYDAMGRSFHWIANLMKHQPLDKPSLPHLPLPKWITYEVFEYKSGKKYAKYTIIPENVPEQYQYSTSTVPDGSGTVRVLPKRNSNGNVTVTETETKQKFHDCVFLTESEYLELQKQFGKEGADKRIKNLDNYIGSKGTKYKSHYKTILVWEERDNGKSGKAGFSGGFSKGDNTAGAGNADKYSKAGIAN